MTTKPLMMSAFAVAIFLAVGSAAAKKPTTTPVNDCAPDCVRQDPVKVSAPEIDVSSGGGAITLLITPMLIAVERARRT